MRIRNVVATLVCGVALVGCQGLKDALSAHSDSAARTVNQDLTAARLGTLLGTSTIGVEPSKENAQLVADLWSDYQRLGYAAAHNDSLTANVDKTVKPIIDNMRVQMMIDTIRAKIKVDTSNAEAAYNAGTGGLLAARHILFKYPLVNDQPGTATPAGKDSVRKIALAVLPKITAANFKVMAAKYSGDASNAKQGGMLGVFPREQMMVEFSNGTAALKPGEVSKSLVETGYGLHVIQRLPYSEAKAQFDAMYPELAQRVADSTMSAMLIGGGDVKVKPKMAAPVKEAIKNEMVHRKDKTVIATFKGGEMTMAQFLGWVAVMPLSIRQQVVQIIPTYPDSGVESFIKNMAMRQLLLHQADSAKVDVPAPEKANLTAQFGQLVQQIWGQLGLNPKDLADSAKSQGDREKLAARRVDTLMARIMSGQANPVGVPSPLKAALDSKWDVTVSASGIDRAVEAARKAKTSADSARAGTASQVPVPGMPGPMPQTPTAPPPATKKKP